MLDFGLAKFQARKATAKPGLRSRTGVVMGTLQYMSPNSSPAKVDHRTDIYSFGVVLDEMATGRRSGKGLESIGSPELNRIVRKSLEPRPDSRYQTARELLVDLRNMRRDKPEPIAVRRWPWIAAGVVGLIAIAIVVAVVLRTPVTHLPIDSLAVLPFVNTGRDAQSEFLTDGMTETIINKLAELPQLRVMSRSTMFRYKGKNSDPQEVGRQLRVKAVLTGHVLQLGNRLSIQTELVSVADGSQLWGERYERPASTSSHCRTTSRARSPTDSA